MTEKKMPTWHGIPRSEVEKLVHEVGLIHFSEQKR